MLKVLDLLDTVFFVLRKKNNQITFLHVYHHAAMVFGTWIAVKFLADLSQGVVCIWLPVDVQVPVALVESCCREFADDSGVVAGLKVLIVGGHATYLGLINSIVHAFMYTYYLLTNINPDYKKSIWWKKYITQLQMAQFLILVIQSIPVLFKEDCNYPRSIGALLVTQNSFMLVLFYDFYRKAYHSKKIAQS
ncbi:unnamed protein product [Timema podura]|uniref:Elongation of very long chain fatty acids protein n=1 Tax=Timema podura TaxID=61482 RepID=A0ABN7PE76_TIMPD|nr:unnamed protein product [Timema podura]